MEQVVCYNVQKLPNRGNGVVATRDISGGEVIVKNEAPFVWHPWQNQSNRYHPYCSHCGTVLRAEIIKSLQSELETSSTYVTNPHEVLNNALESLIGGDRDSETTCHCPRGCGSAFCSPTCLNTARQQGHDWLCSSFTAGTGVTQLADLEQIDEQGHVGAAAKVYARIAAITHSRYRLDTSQDLAALALTVAKELLEEYHYEDFCLTKHAFRTGRLEVDPDMFDRLLFPAYFDGHLATPLAVIKQIFAISGSVLFSYLDDCDIALTSVPSDVGRQRAQLFVHSEIFTDKFFSRVMGTFAVNNVSVVVPSPLNDALAQAMLRRRGTALPPPPGTVSPSLSPSVYDDVVQFLQSLQLKQYESRAQTDVQDDDEEGQTNRANNGSFDSLTATGLFSQFSKTNHSCLSNTHISSARDGRVSVTITAAEDIAQGQEVTNCYIHHDSLHYSGPTGRTTVSGVGEGERETSNRELHRLNQAMTKKQRYKALRQYVFECACPLCDGQEVDSDEDSDY